MLKILASGQSNSIGFNQGGIADFDPRLLVWNNQNYLDSKADLSRADDLGSSFIPPEVGQPPFAGMANCPMVHAASEVARLTGEDVRLVFVGLGGTSMVRWIDSTGLRGAMFQRVTRVLEAAGLESFDAFFWHQGEGDNRDPEGYPQKWTQLIRALKQEVWLKTEAPSVIGETAAMWTKINPVLRALPSVALGTHFVPLSDLPTSDGRHFLGEHAREIGTRYAKVWLRASGREAAN